MPVLVERKSTPLSAVQWLEGNETDMAVFVDIYGRREEDEYLVGGHSGRGGRAKYTDWVLKTGEGNFVIMPDEKFKKMYDIV